MTQEKLKEMYDKILNVAYDTADKYPSHKGIMLYEAQMIIDILKEYIFEQKNKA